MIYTQITHQRILMMIVVIFLILLHSGSGELEILSIKSPIKTLLGHNTTLPCLFYGYVASPLDLSMVSVRWTLRTLEGEEKQVYWYDGRKHIQTRPGSYIPHRGLMRGDGSLYISKIQFSDNGVYTCTVFVTPEKAISKVTMWVSAIPTCTLSDSRLEMYPDTERSVTCYVNSFYPEHVIIRWVKNSKSSSKKSDLDNRTCTSIPVQNCDGTYNVRSLLVVRPMSTNKDGDEYSCVILHRSLKKDDCLTCNVTLSVKPVPDNAAPIIVITFGIFFFMLSVILFGFYRIYSKKAAPVFDQIEANLESYNVGDHLVLTCRINAFRPRYINVIWYKGKEALASINSGAQKARDGLFYVTSSVMVTVIEEDFGEIFRCKVEHPGTPDNDEGVTWTLQRQSDKSKVKESEGRKPVRRKSCPDASLFSPIADQSPPRSLKPCSYITVSLAAGKVYYRK